MNKHIDSDTRYQIQIGLAKGLAISAIAQGIGYSASTVYREIARNGGGTGYQAKFAQQRANARALRSRNARTTLDKTWHSVDYYLRLEHSPEQIAGLIDISHETIYRYIYRDKKAQGCLHLHLRCQKPYRKRCSGDNRNRRGQISNQRRIDERAVHIEARAQVGHWEFDSIVGPSHASSLITGVERKSGYVVMALLDKQGAEGACKAMVELLKPLAGCVKTITTDNGGEFALHERLDAQLEQLKMTHHPFDHAMQLLPGEAAHSFAGASSRDYWNMVGPFGGYTAALAVQAVMQHPALLGEPVALTVNYAGATTQGPFTVTATPARTNRSTQHWVIALSQTNAAG
eukprot:gene37354-48854_t